jgi:hypothetical protein
MILHILVKEQVARRTVICGSQVRLRLWGASVTLFRAVHLLARDADDARAPDVLLGEHNVTGKRDEPFLQRATGGLYDSHREGEERREERNRDAEREGWVATGSSPIIGPGKIAELRVEGIADRQSDEDNDALPERQSEEDAVLHLQVGGDLVALVRSIVHSAHGACSSAQRSEKTLRVAWCV